MTRLTTKEVEALRFLLRVLEGFEESSVYEVYKEAEGFTDAQWEQAIEMLRAV